MGKLISLWISRMRYFPHLCVPQLLVHFKSINWAQSCSKSCFVGTIKRIGKENNYFYLVSRRLTPLGTAIIVSVFLTGGNNTSSSLQIVCTLIRKGPQLYAFLSASGIIFNWKRDGKRGPSTFLKREIIMASQEIVRRPVGIFFLSFFYFHKFSFLCLNFFFCLSFNAFFFLFLLLHLLSF